MTSELAKVCAEAIDFTAGPPEAKDAIDRVLAAHGITDRVVEHAAVIDLLKLHELILQHRKANQIISHNPLPTENFIRNYIAAEKAANRWEE